VTKTVRENVSDLADPRRWWTTSDGKRIQFRSPSTGNWKTRFYIWPSKIGEGAGLGLFAARSFKKGENVTKYMGRVMGPVADADRLMQVDTVNGQGEHTLRMGGQLVDGLHGSSGAQYINSAFNTEGKNNVAFNHNGTVVATKAIAALDELLVAYGPSFWNGVKEARAWAAANPAAAQALQAEAPALKPPKLPKVSG